MAGRTTEYYFEVLGVNRQSTKVEIRDAYRQLIKKWHPDKFPNDTEKNLEATEKSKLLNEAYYILKDYEPASFKKPSSYSPPYTTSGSRKGRHDILRTIVKSSNIHSVGYDTIESILQVQFLNGGIYEYYGVPENIFNDLMNAESKGKYANRHIFYSYNYDCVG